MASQQNTPATTPDASGKATDSRDGFVMIFRREDGRLSAHFDHHPEETSGWMDNDLRPLTLVATVPLAQAAAAPALLEACEEIAAFIEEQYRQALGFASKAEKDRNVAEHVILKSARAAIAAAKGVQ